MILPILACQGGELGSPTSLLEPTRELCSAWQDNDDSRTRTTMDAIKKVYNDHPKTVVFSSAAILRILLAVTFPNLPDLLTSRVEVSTPVNSFKRCTLNH